MKMPLNKNLSPLLLVLYLILSYSTLSFGCNICDPQPASPPPAPTKPKASPPTPTKELCPLDNARLRTCAGLLGLVNVIIGKTTPSPGKCCGLVAGLTDGEAAFCFCTVIKENIMGTTLTVPVSLKFLVSACLRTLPPGFECPF